MAKFELTGDDVFDQFIAKKNEQEAAEAARKANRGSNNSNNTTYEQPEWLGLSKEKARLIRFVGKPFVPGGYRNPTDAKEINVAKIKDDEGKTMYLYLPLRDEDSERDHIMWKIIDDVMHKEWVQKKLVPINEVNHPDIFKMVNKGGYTEADGKWPFMYATGWKGKQVLIVNCIDRLDSWCSDNKHTKLLSKSVNTSVNKDGEEVKFADIGVPAYGFNVIFKDLLNKDKNWENYDVAILATGDKSAAYKIVNSSRILNMSNKMKAADPDFNPEELLRDTYLASEDYDKIVVSGLTEEELNFDRYDLDKLFHVTSYRSISKRLGNSIRKIDAALGTHYSDDLQKLVDNEEAEWKAAHPDNETKEDTTSTAEQPVAPTTENTKSFDDMEKVAESAPLPTRQVSSASEKYSILKGYNNLTDAQKALITDVSEDGKITWSADAPAQIPCDKCQTPFPSNWTICPVCAQKYSV